MCLSSSVPSAPPPQQPRTQADPTVLQAQRKRLASQNGAQGSILTGAQGLMTQPTLGLKTLLGR